MPIIGLEAWMKTDEATRKAAEDKMKADWDAWMKVHGTNILETAGTGKNVRVTKAGASEVKNDIMLYSIVQAESPEAVSQMCVNHPHLDIPEAWIEIMPVNALPQM